MNLLIEDKPVTGPVPKKDYNQIGIKDILSIQMQALKKGDFMDYGISRTALQEKYPFDGFIGYDKVWFLSVSKCHYTVGNKSLSR